METRLSTGFGLSACGAVDSASRMATTISNHPMFNGVAIGRAAEIDFRKFAASVDGLDGAWSCRWDALGPQV